MMYLLNYLFTVYAVLFVAHVLSNWTTVKEICTDIAKSNDNRQVVLNRSGRAFGSYIFVAGIESLDNMVDAANVAIHVINQFVSWFKVQTKYESRYETKYTPMESETKPTFPALDPRS
jgi:hypothetical protein